MRTRTKWIWISILILAAALFGAYRYYIYVMQDTWKQEDAAILRAKQEAGLVKTIEAAKSVWDDVCWVVEGEDATGGHIMVWLEEGKEPHVEQVNSANARASMKARIKALMPKAHIEKLTPGIYENQYVWQLYYKQGDHHYYRFFRFTDGSPLTEEFTLPNR